MHKGGIADKVGNRYEARWLTHQLLGLLDGTVQSITIEALGDDEQGFEFSLMRAGGAEWHQCKRQTAAGTWSIAALDGAAVLSAFRAKTSSPGPRCLFVLSDPSPQLNLLQDKRPDEPTHEAFTERRSEVAPQPRGGTKASGRPLLGPGRLRRSRGQACCPRSAPRRVPPERDACSCRAIRRRN